MTSSKPTNLPIWAEVFKNKTEQVHVKKNMKQTEQCHNYESKKFTQT